MPRPVRIRTVEPLEDFKVRLEFTDNTSRKIDLEPYLHGPIFEQFGPMPTSFVQSRLILGWARFGGENGADIDPDVLYKGIPPAWMEEEDESVGRRSEA